MDSAPKKILYTATTDIHLQSFHIPYLQWFKDRGYEVHVAYKGTNRIPVADVFWDVPFGRSPFDKQNITAYRRLRKILREHHFDLIHCHTPMGGVITRLAAWPARRKGTKVLYTAHGFHFYKGGPLKNWLVFFPIEWLLSAISDAVITINREDLAHLHDKRFPVKGKYMINGIGLNPDRLMLAAPGQRDDLKTELGYAANDFLILYIAEFIDRKNHRFVLGAMPQILQNCPNARLILAGGGELKSQMEAYARTLGISERVDFLGFRKDVGKFISVTDLGISASKQEGLGLGVAEMMFNSIPVVISEDRGHKELVQHPGNGFMFAQGDSLQFVQYICELYHNETLRLELGAAGKESMEAFLIDASLERMSEIYRQYV